MRVLVDEWAVFQRVLRNTPRGMSRLDDRWDVHAIFLWFRTGAPWCELFERYVPRNTLCTRFNRWKVAEVWGRIFKTVSVACQSRPLMVDRSGMPVHQLGAAPINTDCCVVHGGLSLEILTLVIRKD